MLEGCLLYCATQSSCWSCCLWGPLNTAAPRPDLCLPFWQFACGSAKPQNCGYQSSETCKLKTSVLNKLLYVGNDSLVVAISMNRKVQETLSLMITLNTIFAILSVEKPSYKAAQLVSKRREKGLQTRPNLQDDLQVDFHITKDDSMQEAQ